jgi:ribosomal protein S18
MAKNGDFYHTSRRFPDRGGSDWVGPLIDYKEVELLRKFLTTSSKLMSRKRAGTSAQEQKALKQAIKRARYLALVPYTGV